MMQNKLLIFMGFSAVISGCSMAPDYRRPAAELPQAWQAAPAQGQNMPADRWWTLYQDGTLNLLVEEALVYNQDLALATARLDEARALARIADAQLVPAVDAAFQRDRTRRSDSTATRFPGALENNNYRTQVNVSYEIDLWGKLRDSAKAAQSELLATTAARETVRIAITTSVVQSYYALIALDAQVDATRRSLALRQHDFKLQRVRADAGIINDFSLRQLEAEVAAAQAQLPALESRRTSEELALGVLLGRSPRSLLEDNVLRNAANVAPAAPVIPADLPSTLLLRRPDIVTSEQQLIAANARIGAARATLFPSIGLSGYLGSESAALSNLFSGPAGIWQLGFGLAQPIFQGGRLFGEIEAVEARQRQALAQYQKTLQTAFRETHDALVGQVRAREAFDAENARVVALTEALRLARIRFVNGLTSQLEVLDAERNLLNAELNRADALRAQRSAVANVVKAMGGGWTGLPGADSAPAQAQSAKATP